MPRDVKKVINQVQERWISVYGDHIGMEEIRRTMSSMLYDLQAEELRGVFSGWSAEDLSLAIRETADVLPEPEREETASDGFVMDIDQATPNMPGATVPKVVVRRKRRTNAELAAAGHPKHSKK
jgi:hypothetical protein